MADNSQQPELGIQLLFSSRAIEMMLQVDNITI